MPTDKNYIRRFRVLCNKYEDCWTYGIRFHIDWVGSNGKRDKYIVISLGSRDILIGLLSKDEGD